jgi:hypothetical protein
MDDVPIIIDVSTSEELRKPADEVATSGIGRILARGGTPVAIVTPLSEPTATPQRRNAERVLDIIGIGSSGGSDIARFKNDYVADAVEHRSA